MVAAFTICPKVRLKEIGKEEYLQNKKYQYQLYDNDYPEFFTNGHPVESLIIELKNIS
jgi:hypothetical protein